MLGGEIVRGGMGRVIEATDTRAAGFDDEIVKPVGLDDLRALLASL